MRLELSTEDKGQNYMKTAFLRFLAIFIFFCPTKCFSLRCYSGHRYTKHIYTISFHIGPILSLIFDVQYLTNCMLLTEPKKKKL